jgi:hypothetical protein
MCPTNADAGLRMAVGLTGGWLAGAGARVSPRAAEIADPLARLQLVLLDHLSRVSAGGTARAAREFVLCRMLADRAAELQRRGAQHEQLHQALLWHRELASPQERFDGGGARGQPTDCCSSHLCSNSALLLASCSGFNLPDRRAAIKFQYSCVSWKVGT